MHMGGVGHVFKTQSLKPDGQLPTPPGCSVWVTTERGGDCSKAASTEPAKGGRQRVSASLLRPCRSTGPGGHVLMLPTLHR